MRYLIQTFLILSLLAAVTRAEPPRYWSQSIIAERSSTDAPQEVELGHIAQREILTGGLSVTNKSPELDSRASIIVIEGHQSDDGTFWPIAELQVQREKGGEWTKIGMSGDERTISQLKIYTGTTVFGLRINLNPFKGYRGKFMFGRIVLKSGHAAEFLLGDLEPPGESKDK